MILQVKDDNGNWIGIPSIKGEPGYTPQKGIDYFTDDDKAEIVEEVMASLPNGDEVSY